MPPKRTASPESDTGILTVVAPHGDLPETLEDLRRWRDRRRDEARDAMVARQAELDTECLETERAAHARMRELMLEKNRDEPNRLAARYDDIDREFYQAEERIRNQEPPPSPIVRMKCVGTDDDGVIKQAGESFPTTPERAAALIAAGAAEPMGTAKWLACRLSQTRLFGGGQVPLFEDRLMGDGSRRRVNIGQVSGPAFSFTNTRPVEIDPALWPSIRDELGHAVAIFDTYSQAAVWLAEKGPLPFYYDIGGVRVSPDRPDMVQARKDWANHVRETDADPGEKEEAERRRKQKQWRTGVLPVGERP